MFALLALVIVLGLSIGSFLNVIIHRVPRGESLIAPSSRCPSCQVPIKNRHNVPLVSWLLLRGRCASCSAPISIRYPVVEALTAALFVAVTLRFGLTLELPAYLYLAAITVALAMIDLDVYRLPNAIVLPSYLVSIALFAPACIAGGSVWSAVRATTAMAALWLFFFAIHRINPRGMGYGDVKLAGLLGLYLGWVSWSSVLVGAFAGFVIGSVAGGALMLARRVGRRTVIPFGPAMLAGAMLALFISAQVSDWYRSVAHLTA